MIPDGQVGSGIGCSQLTGVTRTQHVKDAGQNKSKTVLKVVVGDDTSSPTHNNVVPVPARPPR